MPDGPDILGIGASRSGSSWLHLNLGVHPDIWVTPVKELHYFDIFRPGAENRGLYWTQYRRHARNRILSSAARFFRLQYGPRNLAWDSRYFIARRDDDWYRSLFRPACRQISGEVTPAYALLPDHVVGEVAAMFPRLKVIYLMRDPISRSWSNLANRYRRLGKQFIGADEGGMIDDMSSGGIMQRSDYRTAITRWERHFPSEQIFYGFFDEIRERPKDLLLRIFDFLGVEVAEAALSPDIDRPRNSVPNSKVKIPKGIEVELAQLHLGNLEWLTERFGAYPARWLERARNCLL